jgi:hypothetical protein
MANLPRDTNGEAVTPERILDVYLNTGDYDDSFDGWVGFDGKTLRFQQASEDGDGVSETYSWSLELKHD